MLSRGFTLVELLVSMGILLMVTAVAMPALRSFNNSQEVDNSAAQLINNLRRAQSSAATRIKCPNGDTSSSWQVNLSLSTASDTYALVANCVSPAAQTVLTTRFNANQNSSLNLKAVTDVCGSSGSQGVNISLFFANQQFTYQCNGGSVLSGTVKITISDTSNNARTVVIESGGIIRSE